MKDDIFDANRDSRSEALLQQGKSSWDRAQEVRRKDPKLYWSYDFQKKLHQRALKEKEAFYEKKAIISEPTLQEDDGNENDLFRP